MKIDRAASPTPADRRTAILESPGFGSFRTDHYLRADYTEATGWGAPIIGPYADLSLDPSVMGLHYGQLVFEGMKAFVQPDGRVALFRPRENARRLNQSAVRLGMPELDEDLFVEAARRLVETDRSWVPTGPGQSLYLRPLMFASEAHIGLRPATEHTFIIVATPVDPFFAADLRALSVWIERDYVRAVRGGTGDVKCAGNYAASMIGKRRANDEGCDEALWLDAIERRWVEELGATNLFFVLGDDHLVTPPLDGSILAGITRASVIELAPAFGYQVEERRISIDEVLDGAASGTLTEAFACGTAAVIAPIGTLVSADAKQDISAGRIGLVTATLRTELLAIQRGESSRFPEWRTLVAES